MITILIESYKRLTTYQAGGLGQEEYVIGIGWIVADDQEWNLNVIDRIRELSRNIT